MKIKINKISKKIRNLRETCKFTQEALAERLGISRQSIISIEQGRCLPSLPLALSLAEAFEISLDNFFEVEQKSRREVMDMAYDLSPWTPMRELASIHDTLDRLFEESLTENTEKTALLMPTVNVYERDGKIVVEADVPGIKEEDLSIEVGDDRVTIAGERKIEEEVSNKDYFRREASYGSFSRTVSLPAEVDKNKADAELKNGTLVVTLHKLAPVEPKTTKIKVKKG